MEQDRPVETPSTQPFRRHVQQLLSKRLSKIFSNTQGLRAGWRLLLYVVIMVVFFLGLKMLLMQFYRSTPGKFSFESLLYSEMIGFISAFGAAVVMSFIEHRPVGSYGLPVHQAFGKLFWQGFLLGFLEISAVVGLIYAFGGYSFGPLALHGAQMAHWAVLWAPLSDICWIIRGVSVSRLQFIYVKFRRGLLASCSFALAAICRCAFGKTMARAASAWRVFLLWDCCGVLPCGGRALCG